MFIDKQHDDMSAAVWRSVPCARDEHMERTSERERAEVSAFAIYFGFVLFGSFHFL